MGGADSVWCSRPGGRGGDGGSGARRRWGRRVCGGQVSGFLVVASAADARHYLDALMAANRVRSLPAGGRGGAGGFSPGQSGSPGLDGQSVAFRLAE